ncbi:MAG: DoxX family protein [Chitinophagaceae bacterium]|jgi:putative oxidoreductase|nr:DoxX family protein [Chitinophagaceae bacterium]
MRITEALDRHSDTGVLLLRLFTGARLIYGVADNVLQWHHMLQFRDFLSAYGFPFPLAAAVICVYTQLVAGLMIILGWHTRFAAMLMIINFIIALAVVHRSDSFEQMTPALALLFACILFFFQGAGRYAVDKTAVPEQSKSS